MELSPGSQIIKVIMEIQLVFLNIITREEATEYIEIGSLNGLFVLGRTIGFIGKQSVYITLYILHHYYIGHYLDQKRLKQGLYRHPWDDISYLTPDVSNQ